MYLVVVIVGFPASLAVGESKWDGKSIGEDGLTIPLPGNFRRCGNPCPVAYLATWVRWNFALCSGSLQHT